MWGCPAGASYRLPSRTQTNEVEMFGRVSTARQRHAPALAESLELRTLLSSVFGVVYNDQNYNGIRDAGDTIYVGLNVYVDANDNGSLDAGEQSSSTSANGGYQLDLAAG